MSETIGIYRISLSQDADPEAFEKTMKTQVFPLVGVGNQTRGGIVTAQQLLKSDDGCGGPEYRWIVRWQNQGGSPFGSDNAPADPASRLAAFGAKTKFSRYELAAEDGMG